jgi:membrane protease YdiL (CAAX protease family)
VASGADPGSDPGRSAATADRAPAVEVQWSGWVALAVYVFSIAGALLFGLAAVGALLLYQFATAPPGLALQRAARSAANGVFVVAVSAPAPVIATVLAWWIVRRSGRGQADFLQAMRLAPPYHWGGIAAASAGAFVLSLGLDALAAVLGRPSVPPVLRQLTDTRVEWAVFSLWALAGAALEEILYRGFLFPPAVRRYGPVGGIVLVGLAFGAAHLLTYGPDVVLVGSTLVMGIYLSLVRYVTGSTMPPLVAHVVVNAYASVQLYHLVR